MHGCINVTLRQSLNGDVISSLMHLVVDACVSIYEQMIHKDMSQTLGVGECLTNPADLRRSPGINSMTKQMA